MNKQNSVTYILGGGFMRKAPDKGCAFYRTIVDNCETANILICCFAMPLDQWQTGFDNDKEMFLISNERSSLQFQNAKSDIFLSQIAWADIIVFRGGATQDLMKKLVGIPGWQDNLAGKIIVGSSAGAHILSSCYVATDAMPRLSQGFGLLPIVIATHYRSTFINDGDVNKSQVFWGKVDKLMESEANGKDIIKLKESDFIIIR